MISMFRKKPKTLADAPQTRSLADINNERILNKIISHNLWEPHGDPDRQQCKYAADAYRKLKSLGFSVLKEVEVVAVLAEKNQYNENFLK